MLSSTAWAWKEKLNEDHLRLSREPFTVAQGNLRQLNRLQKVLPAAEFKRERRRVKRALERHLGFKLKNSREVVGVLKFFGDERLSKATRASAFVGLMNFLMILASVAIVLSVGFLVRDWVLPVFRQFGHLLALIAALPKKAKGALLNAACLAALLLGRDSPAYIRPFVGLFCSLALVIAYQYLRDDEFEFGPEVIEMLSRKSADFSPMTFVILASTAWLYDSSLLGFVAVVHFYVSIGFVCFAEYGDWAFGFTRESKVAWNLAVSGVILLGYVAAVLADVRPALFEVFESGVFFCSTFIYFLALLIIEGDRQAGLLWHLLTFASGLLCFFLGNLSPELSVFRGVGTTFFCLYLMERMFMIKWGDFAILGIFLGGVLVMAYGALMRKYWSYFF